MNEAVAPSQRTPVWQLNPSTRLCWRGFDDEWVVYDTGSGQTHLLAPLAAALLGLIESGPGPEDELVATLASHASDADSALLPSMVQNILGELQVVGLIEVASR